jgi:rRNA methylases
LTGVNISRGVLAMFRRETLPQISEVLQDCRRIAVFDDVENPTNIGAMFRSAAALGIEAVILTGNSSDPLYRRASRVSVGTVFQIPWTRLGNKKNAVNYIDILHSLGFKTVAMALSDNSISIRDERLKQEEKLAIILGNEGYGLSGEVISSSDYVVKIPMKNNVDSLNVAAASSVVFWELCG